MTIVTSGSFWEGLNMRGSDIDIMFVRKKSSLKMDTDDVKPGFTKLRLS